MIAESDEYKRLEKLSRRASETASNMPIDEVYLAEGEVLGGSFRSASKKTSNMSLDEIYRYAWSWNQECRRSRNEGEIDGWCEEKQKSFEKQEEETLVQLRDIYISITAPRYRRPGFFDEYGNPVWATPGCFIYKNMLRAFVGTLGHDYEHLLRGASRKGRGFLERTSRNDQISNEKRQTRVISLIKMTT
jgi:hypothetical protein